MPCPRTQQASLPTCSPHFHFFILSAKQGSWEYHLLKFFGVTRQGNEAQVYRLRCGRSHHYTIAPVFRQCSFVHHRAGGKEYRFSLLRHIYPISSCKDRNEIVDFRFKPKCISKENRIWNTLEKKSNLYFSLLFFSVSWRQRHH